METPDKLDEIIRHKLEGYEAEPSAKVWVNIRQEMKGSGRAGWFTWSMAAAAALLLFVTGFWFLNRDGNPASSFAGNPETKGLWLAFKKGHDLAPRLKGRPAPDEKLPLPQQAPVQNFAVKEKPVQRPVQELRREEKQQQLEQPFIQNPIVQDRRQTPQILEEEQQQAPREMEDKLAPVPVENPIASAKGAEGRGRRKTSSPLKLIAKAGSDIFGLNMSYKEDKKGEDKLMAFHADLGFVKIERTQVK